MTSRFQAADAKSSAAIDYLFGEELQLLPWSQGGGYTTGGGPDTSREVVDFTGTLSGALGSQDTAGDRRGGNFQGSITTRDRTVTVDYAQWPDGAKQGDRIKAKGQPGQPLYEIAGEPARDGMNRWIVPMVRL